MALARKVAQHARIDASVFAGALRRVHEQLASPGVEDSERSARLRQSSPFVGVISREERDAIFAYYETL